MPKRASRNKNPVSPFERVLACYDLDYIKGKFYQCLDSAITSKINLDPSNFKSIKVPELEPKSESTGVITVECKIQSGNSTQYPTIKFRLASKQNLDTLCKKFGMEQASFDQSSVPLDLHRLAALANKGWDIDEINHGDHAIHRCHNKRCFNPEHLYFGTSNTNRSTEFCPVWMLVNEVLVNCCHHIPTCLVPGQSVPTII